MSNTLFSGVTTPETAMGIIICIAVSWVPYHIHTTWCDHSPCAELEFSTPHNMINLITIMVTA